MSASNTGSLGQAERDPGLGPVQRLSGAQLRERLAIAARRAGDELAVIDVREALPFSQSHLIFSTNLPYNRLELEAPERLPRRSVPIVLTDADGSLARNAQQRLHRLGYTDIAVLVGGVEQWQRDGFPVYAGFNVRSKAFAEAVEHTAATPAIDFDALRDLPNGPPVILDSRTRHEYHNATVPTAIHAPGADLVRVVRDLVPDDCTPIVVACGGRTRSIVGAQSLIDAGVPNPVFSLRNGTGGLRLAGQAREHGAQRHAGPPSAAALDWASAAARHAAPNVTVLDADGIEAWRVDANRTLYVLDLREQHVRDALPVMGASPVAGGQLVQEIDQHAPVIGARVLLVDDDDLVRATMTASWLQRLGGLDVAVARASIAARAVANAADAADATNNALPLLPAAANISVTSLAHALATSADDILLIDLSRSTAFRSAHIRSARWSLRDTWQQIWETTARDRRIVLTSEDGRLAALAWHDWLIAQADPERTSDPSKVSIVRVLAGGNRAWTDAGQPTQRVPDDGAPVSAYPDVWLSPQQRGGDVLPHVRAYLDWEIDLVRQVEHDLDFRALVQLT